MLSTAPLTSADLVATSFSYIDCDIPDGQTLAEWRRERNAARRAAQPPRRRFRFRLAAPMWWSS
jgi:hypothetical protein